MTAHSPAGTVAMAALSEPARLIVQAEYEAMVRLCRQQSRSAIEYEHLARRFPNRAAYYHAIAEQTREKAWTWAGFARIRKDMLSHMATERRAA